MKKSLLVLLLLVLVQISAYNQVNVALTKPTSSSSTIGVNLPSLANDADGSNLSYWEGAGPAWWKVDLQDIYHLTSIVIRNFYVAGFPRTYTYAIEVSTDDVNYSPVVSKLDATASTDAGDTYVLTAAARYIRVDMISNTDGPNVQISDFRAYGDVSTPTYTITPSAGTGGTISPPAAIMVDHNANQPFSITPDNGFKISDVLVDGVSVGAVSVYTFSNVTANHTIAATFESPINLALNKPSFSTNNTIGHLAAGGNDEDGSNASYWEGIASAIWKVDLQANYDLTTIIIRNFYVAGFPRSYTYTIESSSDDITYTPLISKSDATATTDEGDKYDVALNARYLRVNMLTNSDGPNVQISDFKVYGKFPLTITGVTATNKVYDGTNSATLGTGSATLVGIFGGDVVTLVSGGSTGTFASKNVASGVLVSTTGFTLAGATAGKYTLTQPTTTANITAKPLTVGGTFTVNNKVYNGNASATIGTNSLTLPDAVGGDAVTLTPVAVFANASVGTTKVVSLTGSTITGADATNYSFSLIGAPTSTANITAKNLTITGLVADNKPYDGNTTATLSGTPSLSGVVSPDVVTLGGTPVATFAAPDVADGVAVTVTGFTITGTDATNYSLTQPAGLTANITVTTGIENLYGGNIACSVYPNPATEFVTLNVTNFENKNLSYILFDSRGNVLENKKVESMKTIVSLQSRLSGTYFIKISDNKNEIKTIKIIKN